ncbi:MAG: dienelactone hydrolase family protein [Bacteroidetes bacterium]|nr:MAG: dienelactone hydrolase family protein [Bacteroidota bacterium]
MKLQILLPAALLIFCSCNSNSDKTSSNESSTKSTETKTPKIKEETVSYKIDTLNMSSYVYYDENIEGKRPAVLVVHEWWGLNDYIKRRARMLAEMGYIAMAVDMYGNGRMGNDPGTAQALATPFYMHPDMAKKHFDAALEELKKNPNVDQSKIAGIGYCFGGGVLLNLARMGEPLNGVVSFHGTLIGTPPDKNLTKAEILVCHGEADSFVPKADVDKFKKQMDSIGKSYTFKSYPGATHAFTNPDATETGKKFKMPIEYNAAADTASWNDMKDFFGRIFK